MIFNFSTTFLYLFSPIKKKISGDVFTEKVMKKLSGVMEMFYILIAVTQIIY